MRARFTSATVSSRPRAHQGHLSFAAVVTVGFVGGALDYVYVKLPARWSFVGRDSLAHSHEVFRDASTGFVYVKLSEGWKFMPATSGQ